METPHDIQNKPRPEQLEEKPSEQQEIANNTSEPLKKLLDILREISLPRSEAEAERVFIEKLSKEQILTEPISTKRGFKIYLVEIDGKRYAVWIRVKPVSREALETAEKILKNYEIDGKILVKLIRKADYIRISKWVKIP